MGGGRERVYILSPFSCSSLKYHSPNGGYYYPQHLPKLGMYTQCV